MSPRPIPSVQHADNGGIGCYVSSFRKGLVEQSLGTEPPLITAVAVDGVLLLLLPSNVFVAAPAVVVVVPSLGLGIL